MIAIAAEKFSANVHAAHITKGARENFHANYLYYRLRKIRLPTSGGAYATQICTFKRLAHATTSSTVKTVIVKVTQFDVLFTIKL